MSLLASADDILASLLSAATSILLLGDGRAIRGWYACRRMFETASYQWPGAGIC